MPRVSRQEITGSRDVSEESPLPSLTAAGALFTLSPDYNNHAGHYGVRESKLLL
jgi:hypothetical protein